MKPGARRQPEISDREILAGLVERVTFHNLENGFCVLRTKARGHRDLVTVVGHAAMVGPGEWITASGEWVNDRTHGQQFKARFMRTSEPSSVEGIEKYLGSGMVRVRAGIGYALTEAMDEGHCGLPEEELGPLAAKLLEVPGELIRSALDLELAEGTVVADTVVEIPCIFLGGLHRAERAIAGRLLGIAAGNLPWPDIDPGKALPWVEGKTGLALAPGQADAVRAALSSKVSVITGGPGVGKTTIVNSILRILSAKGVDILLCAPTGRAAKRMSEAAGLEAKTIHRLLEVDPRNGGFRRDAHNPLHCGLLVIDETSMVDVMLMRALLAAVPDEAARRRPHHSPDLHVRDRRSRAVPEIEGCRPMGGIDPGPEPIRRTGYCRPDHEGRRCRFAHRPLPGRHGDAEPHGAELAEGLGAASGEAPRQEARNAKGTWRLYRQEGLQVRRRKHRRLLRRGAWAWVRPNDQRRRRRRFPAFRSRR